MSDQLRLFTFDGKLSQEAKEAGQEAAASASPEPLEVAREIAIRLAMAREDRTITADDVGVELDRAGIATGPWMGSLFRGRAWAFTGERVRSTRVSNRAREIKRWRLR